MVSDIFGGEPNTSIYILYNTSRHYLFVTEEKKVETVKEELQSVKRQTWLMEEKSAQIKQQCRQLDSGRYSQ